MDFKVKTRFWLQNMSRKLENICTEGPMDLLENQFQTAQRTFRNLYSEFVEDVIPLITSQFNEDKDPGISEDQLSNPTDNVTGDHGEGSNIDIEGDQEDRNYGEVILSRRASDDELCVDTPLQQCEETNLLSQMDESLVDTPLEEIEVNANMGRPSNLSLDVLKMVIPGIEKNLHEEKISAAEARMLVSPAPPSIATGGVSMAKDDQFSFPISSPQESEDTVTGGRPAGKVPLDVLKKLNPGMEKNLHGENVNPVEARIFDSPTPTSMAIGGAPSKASDDHFAYRATSLPQEFEDFFSVEEVDADDISEFPAALTSSSGRRSDSTSAEEAMDDHVIERPAGMETRKPSDNELERSCFELKLRKRYEQEAALEAKVAEKQEHEPQTVSFEDINAEADHRANKEGTVTITSPSLAAANEVVETSDHEDSSDSDWEII